GDGVSGVGLFAFCLTWEPAIGASMDRTSIVTHADNFWKQPCADGVVWCKYRGISIAGEIVKRKLSAAEWTGAFLLYFPTKGDPFPVEGLFLIKRTDLPVALATWQAGRVPSAKLICTFFDDRSKET